MACVIWWHHRFCLFSVKGLVGQSEWSEYFPDCGGTSQSPVDVITTQTKYDSSLIPVTPLGYSQNGNQPFTLFNNGHTGNYGSQLIFRSLYDRLVCVLAACVFSLLAYTALKCNLAADYYNPLRDKLNFWYFCIHFLEKHFYTWHATEYFWFIDFFSSSVIIELPEWMGLGGLPWLFSAVQLHLHWGPGGPGHVGSEHTINGLSADAEVQWNRLYTIFYLIWVEQSYRTFRQIKIVMTSKAVQLVNNDVIFIWCFLLRLDDLLFFFDSQKIVNYLKKQKKQKNKTLFLLQRDIVRRTV